MTVTKGMLIPHGKNQYQIAISPIINIDNGSGTTADYVLLYCANDVYLLDAYTIYTEATDTTGAAGASVKVGTTAGGTEVVGLTNLSAAKAVGAAVQLTLAVNFVAAGTTIRVRHTGIASTEAGQYYVMLRYFYK